VTDLHAGNKDILLMVIFPYNKQLEEINAYEVLLGTSEGKVTCKT
jgi:hypothetical protein